MATDSPTPEIISRKEAKAKGLKYYFTGRPCVKEHITERYVSDYSCIICRAGYDKQSRREYNRYQYNNNPVSRKKRRASIDKYLATENGQKSKAKSIERRHLHKEKEQIYNKQYKLTEKGKEISRVGASRRRALKWGNGGNLSTEEISHLRKTQKTCYLCNKRFTKDDPATIDHIIPLSKGGPHNITNILLAHLSCNSSK